MLRFLSLFFLAVGLLSGVPGVAKPVEAARIAPASCPIKLDPAHFACGTLTVSMTRRPGDPRSVKLPYALFNPQAGRKLVITFLSGGPGFTTLGYAELVAQGLAPLGRSVVFLERRGTGLAEPSLTCPAGTRLPNHDLDLVKVRACAAGFRRQGVDLDAFDSRQAAEDLDDLRRLLGIAQWDLFGISYGTSLAFAVMRDFPQTVHSAVMDSPYPLSIKPAATNVSKHLDKLTQLFAACTSDQTCAARYPDLRARLIATAQSLQKRPLSVNGQRYDGQALVRHLADALQEAEGLPRIPAMIDAAARRDVPALVSLSGGISGQVQLNGVPRDKVYAQGLWFSVECRERLGGFRQEDKRTKEAWPDWFRDLFRVEWGAQDRAGCGAWGVKADPRPIAAPITAAIPTLVMLGEFDPATPPAWGAVAVASLPEGAAQLIVVPGAGHAVSSLPCPQQMIGTFLFDPRAPLDRSCLAAGAIKLKVDR